MYPIIVNGKEIQTNGGRYNGRKIRQLAGVPDDHDLWQRWPAGDDRRIGNDDTVAAVGTPELYSSPREINGA